MKYTMLTIVTIIAVIIFCFMLSETTEVDVTKSSATKENINVKITKDVVEVLGANYSIDGQKIEEIKKTGNVEFPEYQNFVDVRGIGRVQKTTFENLWMGKLLFLAACILLALTFLFLRHHRLAVLYLIVVVVVLLGTFQYVNSFKKEYRIDMENGTVIKVINKDIQITKAVDGAKPEKFKTTAKYEDITITSKCTSGFGWNVKGLLIFILIIGGVILLFTQSVKLRSKLGF